MEGLLGLLSMSFEGSLLVLLPCNTDVVAQTLHNHLRSALDDGNQLDRTLK